jgi:CheY-like chemotaxis protein/DNA-directed RNA polymerase subunit RPC12/RpoP
MAEFHPPEGGEAYPFICVACGRVFDAAVQPWCECITDNPTLVCPHCGACFCQAEKEILQGFWREAPPALWKRKLLKRIEITPPPSEKGNPLRRPLILVADDNEDTRLVAFRVLEELGYGVLLARDGVEAFVMAKHHRPDLVLTDQMMPHMDGKHFSRALKSEPTLAHIPVILMTGLYKKDRERITLLKESMADDFLTKPISFDKLGEVLAGWLRPANGE